MTTRTASIATLLIALIFGVIDGYFSTSVAQTPRHFDFLASVLVMATCYLWYRRDATAHGYRGSAFLGGAIALFTVLVLPYYLARSRRPGQRLRSLFSLLGLLLLSALVYMAALAATEAARGG